MKSYALTNEEIVRYWGSYEEYTEEQRRLGLYAFETQQFEASQNPGYKVSGPGVPGASEPIKAQPKPRFGFRLGWHRA